ncbi:RNA polymerase III RPC4-domain-containing protein [Xylariaceae sp. FL0662B]|nr:RNA polymerase III RPC4-domain-containing protein [Xylariaceae sp. FL0662B]
MPPRSSRGGTGRGRGARGTHSAGISRATFEEATPSTATDGDGTAQDASPSEAPIDSPAPSATQVNQPPAGSSRPPQTTGVPARIGGRFKPKNVRRDAAERARLEEQRNRDLATKIKAEEREQRAEERRARRGRGRGDMARGGLLRRTVTASGPFSAIPSESVKAGHSGWGWGGGGGGGGSGGTGFGPKASSDFDGSRYQPRRENETRVNVELLNGFTGFGDDGSPLHQPARYGQGSNGRLPVGLLRMQHEDEEVKVKTTAELEAEERQSSDEGELFVEDSPVREPRDVGLSDDNEVWHAAPKGQVKVKTEPDTEPESMDIDMTDIPEATRVKAPPSPEVKKKPILTEDAIERARKRRDKMSKDTEVVHNAIDLEALLRELSFSTPAQRLGEQSRESGEQQEQGQEKDNMLYLFQLPPILPPLSRPTDGAEITDLTSQDSGIGASAKVKVEEGSEAPSRSAFTGLPPEGGCIGKMNVRRSGKVEFDWGGTTLNLGMGTETEFLTSAIMLEQNENLENPELSTGFACGMGQVVGKFVLTPIWDEEEDWDPSLDDIDGLQS